jgi:DNA invertase Pin-like site-specific DNA recombinase
MKQELPNALFYGRVSTDRQDTCEEQLAEVRKYCENTSSLKLDESAVGFFQVAVTGEYFSHLKYNQMLDYIRAHNNIRYIVVRDISRFARLEHDEVVLERSRLKTELGIVVLSATEPYLNDPIGPQVLNKWGMPTRDARSPLTPVMRALKDQTNLEFRREIGEKSREGVLAALKRGSPPGGPMSAFFTAIETGEVNPDGKPRRRVIPDPNTRKYHQEMFDFIAGGGSVPELSCWLSEHGVYSPGIRLRNGEVVGNPGRRISPSTLRYELMNYMFIGQFVYNRYWPKGPDNPAGRRMRPREYWHYIYDYCEPTVSTVTFHKVQDIFERRERARLRYGALLTSVLFCESCGSRMTVVSNKCGVAYRCSGKKNKTRECNSTEVSVEHLDAVVERLVLEQLFSASSLQQFLQDELPKTNRENEDAFDYARKQYEQRKLQLEDKLADIRSNTQLPPDWRRTLIADCEPELRSIDNYLNKPKSEDKRCKEEAQAVDFSELEHELTSWFHGASLKKRRELLRVAFKRFVFKRQGRHDRGCLQAYCHFPVTIPVASNAVPSQSSLRKRRGGDLNPRCGDTA